MRWTEDSCANYFGDDVHPGPQSSSSRDTGLGDKRGNSNLKHSNSRYAFLSTGASTNTTKCSTLITPVKLQASTMCMTYLANTFIEKIIVVPSGLTHEINSSPIKFYIIMERHLLAYRQVHKTCTNKKNHSEKKKQFMGQGQEVIPTL